MHELRIRFGRLVAAHRRRCGLTQDALATKAELSTDMITRIEAGKTGARFPSIERLAEALQVDAAELFTSELPSGSIRSKPLLSVTARLSALSDRDLMWIDNLLDAALKSRG
jgi:transcriptional regulator with XRE-family HTH domain